MSKHQIFGRNSLVDYEMLIINATEPHEVGSYVITGLLGELYVAVLLGLLISVPLFVVSLVVQRRSLKS